MTRRTLYALSSAFPWMLALGGLVGAAFVLELPLFGRGGGLYMDNAVHLAEILDLARGNGWSELSFCGFPLSTLHSPLWYGLLAFLVGWGLPVEPLYLVAVGLGLVWPSLALYWVGVRRSTSLQALLMAAFLLILPTSTVGYSSALGGMWTFHLGCGFLILLVDRLAREDLSWGNRLIAGALLAIIGLTHHFVLVAAAIVIVVATFWRVFRFKDWRELLRSGAVALLAALASMGYWGPLMIASKPPLEGQALTLGALMMRIFMPTDLLALLQGSEALRGDLAYTEMIAPLGLLVGAGIALRRGGAERSLRSISLGLGGVVFAFLLLAPLVNLAPLLGPVGWRYVAFIHLSLALVAVSRPWGLGKKRRELWALAALAVTLVASSLWWSRPLAAMTRIPPSQERNIEAVWAWLGENRTDQWGRIYVQDTFWGRDGESLGHTHAPLLAWRHTGHPQVGTYYGIHPYPTGKWTLSEFSFLYGEAELNPTQLGLRARWSNTAAIVLSQPRWRATLQQDPSFEERFQKEQFSIWVRKDPQARWAIPPRTGVTVIDEAYRPGALDLMVEVTPPMDSLLLSLSYHSWWRITPPQAATIAPGPEGLMYVKGLGSGKTSLGLRWHPPVWPWATSLTGWILLAALGGFVAWRKKGRRA